MTCERSLDGITVIDLSRHLPGPMASTMLSDHGAKVIRVDTSMGRAVHAGTQMPSLQRGKETMLLDIKAPRGYELLIELVRRADVFLESGRPGSQADDRIDYETLKAINPGL
ncbi:MAG: CoA transferase, partial [Myxococcota bacterium]